MNLRENCVIDCCVEQSVALENAWKILTANKTNNFVVVQIAPAVRVAIGEAFGLTRGEDSVGKIVTGLRLLGADVVVDTAIASDVLTLLRLKAVRENKENGKKVPVYSSECSAWVAHANANYPEIELLPTATTVSAKLLKKYYSEMFPEKTIRVIALEMGKAKKMDAGVDVVLTLEELTYLINGLEFDLRLIKKLPMKTPLGISSGAAYIAAASGGDAEALARCLIAEKEQSGIRKLAYSGLYGNKARREAMITVNGVEYKFAVVDSLAEADKLIAEMREGEVFYDYVEVTACAGGPVAYNCDLSTEEGDMTRKLRALGLKYLDLSRAARSADVNASAEMLLKTWNALCRKNEEVIYDEIKEIVEDVEEVTEEVVEEVVEEVTEEVVEEVVEEVTEEVVEEVAEEVVEEVAEEVAEEVVEEVAEEVVEEVVEEVAEEVVEEVVEEVAEEVTEEVTEEVAEETPVEENFEEVVEDVFEEEAIEEVLDVFEENVDENVETLIEESMEEIEEIMEETTEEVETLEETVLEEIAPVEEFAEEMVEEEVLEEITEEEVIEAALEVFEDAVIEELASTEEVVEETLEEAPAEEVVEEAPAEEVVEETEEVVEDEQVSEEEVAEEMKHVEELLHVSEENLTKAQKLARAQYYRRLSTKDRRKLKRLKKKNKK